MTHAELLDALMINHRRFWLSIGDHDACLILNQQFRLICEALRL